MGGRDKGLTEGSTAKNYLLVIHWRKKWQPTPAFLPGTTHGQRSLAGYSSWGHKRAGHALGTKQQQITEEIFFNDSFHQFQLHI